MIYRLLITICLCNIAKVSFQWYVRGRCYNLVSVEGRFPFLLGCLFDSCTVSFCFSYGHVARYDPLWKTEFMVRLPRIHRKEIYSTTLNNAPIFRESIVFFWFRRTANSQQRSTRASHKSNKLLSTRASHESNKLFESNESRGIRQHS